MKNRIKEIFSFVTIAAMLLVVGYGYTQTQFNELFDVLFRPQNPQIRVSGTASVRNLAGTGAGAMAMARPSIVTTAATYTLAASECGAVFVGNATTGTQVVTLPLAANVGCMFTFIAGHAGGEILVNSEDGTTDADCVITSFAAVGVDADTGIVTDSPCRLKNTAATNAIGDSLTIVADGTRWLGVGITSGIWAAQ